MPQSEMECLPRIVQGGHYDTRRAFADATWAHGGYGANTELVVSLRSLLP